MATPPHRSSSGHISRVSSIDDGPNLEIITEGAELQVAGERPRSATLPRDVKFAQFESGIKEEEKEEADGRKELADGKKEEGEGKGKEDDEDDKVFSQGKIGEHKFYSFTKCVGVCVHMCVGVLACVCVHGMSVPAYPQI